ncbi:MAG: DUF2256 domain-containing protein [Rhodoferax sp.]|uniref:DUF2256 domain-containing protein n=1 Tax=Rhodoferax sp. TaxID=50421 RepID=UPI0030181243
MGFKGNKSSLPSKTCQTCGRAMTWRKSWAKNWDEVKYCSDACGAKKTPPPGTTSVADKK